MDLDEPFRVEVFTEELADGGLDAEDGLVGRGLFVREKERLACLAAAGGGKG